MAHSNTCSIVVELLQALMPRIVENYQKISPLGSTARAQLALEQLQTLAKSCDTTDTLMVSKDKQLIERLSCGNHFEIVVADPTVTLKDK